MSIAERFSLDGRVALVTGGSRGIGLAIATALAEAGATVALNARHADACEAAAAEIVATGGKAIATPGHVGDAATCEAVVANVMRRDGPARHPRQQRRDESAVRADPRRR